MAAIVHPGRASGLGARQQPQRRHLRVVAPQRRHHLQAAVYWRRRLVALLATLLVSTLLLSATMAAVSAVQGMARQPSPAPIAPPVAVDAGSAVHVVQPGDTFWSIARSLQPTGDVRPLVDRLVAAHGTGSLQVGERVVLPSR